LAKPNTEIADPKRTKLLTDMEEPNREHPNTAKEEPKRANLRKDSELPM
jgi:hypothetical protein